MAFLNSQIRLIGMAFGIRGAGEMIQVDLEPWVSWPGDRGITVEFVSTDGVEEGRGSTGQGVG